MARTEELADCGLRIALYFRWRGFGGQGFAQASQGFRDLANQPQEIVFALRRHSAAR